MHALLQWCPLGPCRTSYCKTLVHPYHYPSQNIGNHQQERTLRWRHNGRDSLSNHQPHDCLLNRLFRRRSKKTSKLRATGLCVRNSRGTGEFPAQMASHAENVSIWWRHHEFSTWCTVVYAAYRPWLTLRVIALIIKAWHDEMYKMLWFFLFIKTMAGIYLIEWCWQ